MTTRLADLTTMRVGGPVRELLEPQSTTELVEAVRGAWQESRDAEEVLVLGGGSNLVAPDVGFDGTVVLTAGARGIESAASDDGLVHLRVAAGESWDGLVAHAVERGLAGITALSGIPGSVGAAPVQNIGAYGRELADVLVGIELLDFESGELERIPAAELGLGYRTSALKRGRRGVVTSIEIALVPDRRAPVRYEQLASSLGVPVGSHVPIDAVRDAVLHLRSTKGMLVGPEYPASCGSFFTNPIVDENWARSLPEGAPRFPVAEEERDLVAPLDGGPAERRFPERREVKLSAAWLIEQSGIPRGYALPGSRAAISPLHTLAITNTGGATSAEVVQLAEFVQSRVSADFGVVLQPEPVILPY